MMAKVLKRDSETYKRLEQAESVLDEMGIKLINSHYGLIVKDNTSGMEFLLESCFPRNFEDEQFRRE